MYVLTVHFDGTVGLATKFEWFLGLDCPWASAGFQAALSWLANLLSKNVIPKQVPDTFGTTDKTKN